MDTVQTRIPQWIGGWAQPPSWMHAPNPRPKSAAVHQPKTPQLTAEDSQRFVRMVSECRRIRRHYDIYCWLNGDVQYFLPHEILLSAWGEFSSGSLSFDVTSGVPGVRTSQLARCSLDGFMRQAHARWVDAARQPLVFGREEIMASINGCHCPLHVGLRGMNYALVHGVHDKRSGQDSLFIAAASLNAAKGRNLLRYAGIIDSLFTQVDAAFRRLPAFALNATYAVKGAPVLELSTRELEVLEAVCKGKTNLDIATALDISPFTVKNHVQRIFRKIGVTNRTQAAARYMEAVRAQQLAKQPCEAATSAV